MAENLVLKVINFDKNDKNFLEMKGLLAKHGVVLTENTLDEEETLICISINEEKLKRHAGRKRKNDSELIKLSEIEKMMSEKAVVDIVKELEIPKATFYRRLNRARSQAEDFDYDPFF